MRIAAYLLLALAVAACGDDGMSTGDDDGNPDAEAPDAEDPDAEPGEEPEPDLPTPAEVVQCTTPLPAASEGSCDVADGTGSAVVVRGNILGDTTIHLDGSVMYDGDRIVCVGCDCSGETGFADATVITCAGAAVSPGLINAHSHLNYDERPPLAASPTRYNHRHGWRGGVPTPNNQHGTGATSAGMRWAELRHLINGTTSIAASTRADGLVRNLDELEARDRTAGFDDPTIYEVFALGDGNETFHEACDWNYKFDEYEVSEMQGLVTHTAEGIDDYAHEEFLCQSRSLPTGEDFVERNVGHIHSVGLTATDYFNMVRDDAKLVWSPRSNVSLYGNTAQAQIFARLGGVVALGTDWTYSGSATLVREMACVASLNDDYLGDLFTPEHIWRMATIHGAQATGQEALIGSITDGKIADLAVFRAEAGQRHEAVIAANTDDVLLVVKDGDIMFGEADVVEALDATCETLDVCGAARRVCAQRDIGVTYASIATTVAAGTPGYPTIHCAPPADEPTCVPTRPSEYTGITAEDPDGDGVIAGDNCPDIFNPVRPMDDGAQADVDGDGRGDACDPSPVGTDIDGDGTRNSMDACPFVDDDQTDTDTDGKGDTCDACPELSNPETVCAPVIVGASITEVQTTLPTGTSVRVTGAVVTAVGNDGFAIQDPAIANGVNAGVWVFVGSAPSVDLGDVVTVSGVTEEYFTMTEIANATVEANVAGTPLAPISLTAAQAAAEQYEGVLVTITDVATVDIPFTCTCSSDTAMWEVNDLFVVWNKSWEGTSGEWDAEGAALDTTPGPVTGVTFYRFNRWRIMPRLAADIAP